MSMSKKDFIALALAVRAMKPDPGYSSQLLYWTVTVKNLLADFCASQNPNFNRERWLAYIAGECGPSGGAIKKGRG